MVKSILDSDLYKFTQQNAVMRLFPDAIVRYEFFNRDNREFPEGFADALKREIEKMSDLRLRDFEVDFLKKRAPFLPAVYRDFLRGYQFDPNEVKISQEGPKLRISFEGYWYRTILWETPTMATISELYFKMTGQQPLKRTERKAINRKKAEFFDNYGIGYAEFGARRRFSFDNQIEVVDDLLKYGPNSLNGSSNPYIAMQFNIPVIGTQAHEFFMFMAAKYGYLTANQTALEKWVEVYQGSLGIALTDTFTTDVFFKDFTMKYAKLFDGLRHDSGDPRVFVNKTLRHYQKLGINPKSKTIVFSDGLNMASVKAIHDYCSDFCQEQIKDSYGIGTNLTNDCGVKPLNIVIKLTGVLVNEGWVPTVKLSDDEGKHTGDSETVELCKKILKISLR